MKYIKEIEPYNIFWGNCITNMFLTFLLKNNPSYEPIIYLNDYEYIYETDNAFRMDYTQEYYDYFKDNIFIFNCCNFIDKSNIIAELKEILINNKYITINIDLFYWNNQGPFFNKIHKSHFSNIIGFDDDADIFYAIEDDINLNYKIMEIPTKTVIQAFCSEFKDSREDYRIITFKSSEPKPYQLNKNQIILNSSRIIKNIDIFLKIDSIIINTLLDDIHFVNLYIFEFGKISYRLKGNILLFKKLTEFGMMSENLTCQLTVQVNEICKKWLKIKNIFFKQSLCNKVKDTNKVEKLIKEAFIDEKEMWLKFIELIN